MVGWAGLSEAASAIQPHIGVHTEIITPSARTVWPSNAAGRSRRVPIGVASASETPPPNVSGAPARAVVVRSASGRMAVSNHRERMEQTSWSGLYVAYHLSDCAGSRSFRAAEAWH